MIKKSIKKLVIVGLFIGIGLGAMTLEEFNMHIANVKHPDGKQAMTCEREAVHLMKNPQECIRAAEMLINSRKNLKSGYRFDFFGASESSVKDFHPHVYNQTDKEFIDESIAQSYYNAGVIYKILSEPKAEVKMYKKALEYKPNYVFTNLNIGIAYYYGEGVGVNKVKAYEHWRIAARQGNEQSQQNLDILCSESPWACK